ncbi:hypothetical protein RUM43_014345 [Polyplax serrata]|uniref:Uncharacterized protein n=1 Tax=Polyplax serrata TaxID=468196 RepID=A0AAN8PSR7_POLSC
MDDLDFPRPAPASKIDDYTPAEILTFSRKNLLSKSARRGSGNEPTSKPEGEEFDEQNVALSLRLDKLNNAYIAVGTLACALFIVTLTVAICHCRVHETYKKCFLNSTPLLPCKIRKLDILPKHSRTVKPLLGYPKDQTPMPARSFPTLDTTDVYYTLDFSDNQNAPLIQ